MPETSGQGRPPTSPGELIDSGDLQPEVNATLQQGGAAYRTSKLGGEALFRKALELAPDALPVYFCLYKIHTYQGDLDAALVAAQAGLAEAASQAGWPASFVQWPAPERDAGDAARFVLYTLKALAFIRLKRGEAAEAGRISSRLEALDLQGRVGWRVIANLLAGLSS